MTRRRKILTPEDLVAVHGPPPWEAGSSRVWYARAHEGNPDPIPCFLWFRGSLPSLNPLFTRQHWTKRHKMTDLWKGRVLEGLSAAGWPLAAPIPWRVSILVHSFMVDPCDASNVTFKPLEDALKGRVIVDDSPDYVQAVHLESIRVPVEAYASTRVAFVPAELDPFAWPRVTLTLGEGNHGSHHTPAKAGRRV